MTRRLFFFVFNGVSLAFGLLQYTLQQREVRYSNQRAAWWKKGGRFLRLQVNGRSGILGPHCGVGCIERYCIVNAAEGGWISTGVKLH